MKDTADVVIVGGGPAGSTVGSLLKKYSPDLKVVILEREFFPRDHVGESLLPIVGKVLNEVGVWDQIEAAGFPIKIGATYKWGTTDDLWDFNLLDTREVVADAPRPGKYEGWRTRTAWQVNRSEFDKILLDRSIELGCEVYQGAHVTNVRSEADSITAVELADGREFSARYIIDASGNTGFIRRALCIESEEPPSLRNIAIWDHWDNADWAVTIGTGATRVQITSIGYGWIWFIPISATRTSIGLVCPAEYYKNSGKNPDELYNEAVRKDSRVAALIAKAKPTGSVKGTKDWSFYAKRMVGKNWFLVGDSAGFADPILSAGISITAVGAMECAFTIRELDRGELDADWLKESFAKRQVQRISQHIKFANFWYSANAHFTDLVQFTSELARDAGLELEANDAWQWFGAGGFVSQTAGAGVAGHSLEQIANLQGVMFAKKTEWMITKSNVFRLKSEGTVIDKLPIYADGGVKLGKVVRRGAQELPLFGGFKLGYELLQRENKIAGIMQQLRLIAAKLGPNVALSTLEAIESMLRDGWAVGSLDPSKPCLKPEDIPRTPNVAWNRDRTDPKVRVAEALTAGSNSGEPFDREPG
jgi:flavin-dependent dehydrogenase